MSAASVRLRRALPADRRALEPLLLTQLREHRAPADDARIVDALDALLADPGVGRVLVAERDATLVGVAQLSFGFALEHGGRTAWLDELYVVPALRGAGIGSRLLAAALDEAKRAGANAMDLEVDADHARAAGLYERNGFSALPRRRFYRPL